MRLKIFSRRNELIGYTQVLLGNCLTNLHRFDDAQPMLLEGYAVLAKASTAQPSRRREALVGIVTLYERWGKPAKAADFRALLSNVTTRATDGDTTTPNSNAASSQPHG
jgi:hypothetical protein